MLESALRFMTLVWEAFRRALVLDEQLLVAVEAAPAGVATWIVATIVFLAGVAQLLGQSAVLFINQVRPRRFVLSLLLTMERPT